MLFSWFCPIKIDVMFPTSSQSRYWTFKNEEKIEERRVKHNQDFVERHRYQLGLDVISSLSPFHAEIHNFCCFFDSLGRGMFAVLSIASRGKDAAEKL